MSYNTLLNHKDVDKASYLRDQDIFSHKDFNIDKIRLTIIWDSKFPVNIINNDYLALWLTLKLAFLSTLILLIFSPFIAWWLAKSKSQFRPLFEALIALPLILPPTVLGFYLLISRSI